MLVSDSQRDLLDRGTKIKNFANQRDQILPLKWRGMKIKNLANQRDQNYNLPNFVLLTMKEKLLSVFPEHFSSPLYPCRRMDLIGANAFSFCRKKKECNFDCICFTRLMPIADLILRVENACRNVSESIRFVCY